MATRHLVFRDPYLFADQRYRVFRELGGKKVGSVAIIVGSVESAGAGVLSFLPLCS